MEKESGVMCCIEGCGRGALYKEQALCQKHYFRMRRYGTPDLTRSPRKVFFRKNPRGYVQIYAPSHPLAMSDGFAYEHRVVAYDSGLFTGACAMCGKPVTWKNCHTDHIDKIVDNNAAENLRITCRACNTFRDRPRKKR
jgi:ferredoxin